MTVNVDRNLTLPESEYFAEPQAKSGIALHHTVCDDAHTTVSLWRADKTAAGTPRHVATVYVIDRDGTVFELFDPAAWRFTWVCPGPTYRGTRQTPHQAAHHRRLRGRRGRGVRGGEGGAVSSPHRPSLTPPSRAGSGSRRSEIQLSRAETFCKA